MDCGEKSLIANDLNTMLNFNKVLGAMIQNCNFESINISIYEFSPPSRKT